MLRRHLAGLVLMLLVLAPRPLRAQDEVRNFKIPILTVETGGHHARVRSLLWQDDFTLFSGGEDKVVKAWDFHQEPRLARSIRPMIWRGTRGIIYAMAISPKPDAQGQSFLAVAGFGIESSAGDITVFRVPGLLRAPTGEIAARLLPPPDGDSHENVVGCLAFDRTGRVLASASGGPNPKIILWNVPGFQRRAVLQGHTDGVRALAFSPDGSRLASGGADGSLRIWDVAQGVPIEALPAIENPPNPINTLAYSPNGQLIATGREAPGRIDLYQAANLAAPPTGLPIQDGRGPIEYLAFHPDAQKGQLAVSIKSDASQIPDAMRMGCDVEIWDLPANALQNRRRVAGLVYSLAFSPDGRRLAYAGGLSQAIEILDPNVPEQPPRIIQGAGTTPFDLRFTKNSKVLAFTRETFDLANPPLNYIGFDLEKREPQSPPRAELPHGAITEYQGWTLQRGNSPLDLVAVHTNGQSRTFTIDRRLERNAWSYTIIPIAKDHPHPAVAIGTESGVAVFNLDTGARTHFYAGHSSPVVSLAPSGDARWLASSSFDQTILLYRLEGCDERSPLGAEFHTSPDGVWTVASVVPRSFAAGMGMTPGDILVQIGIAGGAEGAKYFNNSTEFDTFFGLLPNREPSLYTIGIKLRRTTLIPSIGPLTVETVMPTTRRNNPSLALFLGLDREWVLWTPQGYYDTSIEGDARFLGWHINPPFRSSRPTDFVPISTFADTMNRRDILDRLWSTGLLDTRLNAPAPVAASRPPSIQAIEDQPPRITFAPIPNGLQLPAPGVLWVVNRPDVRVSLRLMSSGKSEIRRRRIILDERTLPGDPNIGPIAEFTEDVALNSLVPNRRVRLTVEASNVAGIQRTDSIDLLHIPLVQLAPKPEKKPARLHVLAIGSGQSAGGLPPIDYAGADAKSLSEWLADHLTSADGTHAAASPPQILTDSGASTQSIESACNHLHELVQKKVIHEHDIVAVVLKSHLLVTQKGIIITASDTVGSSEPRPVVPTLMLGEALGELTGAGCRVVVFLDGVHPKVDEPLRSEIKPFVRDLQRKRGVIVFIASKEGPSRTDQTSGHGYFAEGVLRSFNGADLAATRKDRSAATTLDQFRTAVINEVSNLSGRQQRAFCYAPEQVPLETLFVRPRE